MISGTYGYKPRKTDWPSYHIATKRFKTCVRSNAPSSSVANVTRGRGPSRRQFLASTPFCIEPTNLHWTKAGGRANLTCRARSRPARRGTSSMDCSLLVSAQVNGMAHRIYELELVATALSALVQLSFLGAIVAFLRLSRISRFPKDLISTPSSPAARS